MKNLLDISYFTRILRQGNVFSSSGHLQIVKKQNELDLSLSVFWTQIRRISESRATYWKYSSVFENRLLIVIQHLEYKSFENSRIKQSSRESIETTRLIFTTNLWYSQRSIESIIIHLYISNYYPIHLTILKGLWIEKIILRFIKLRKK